MIKVERLKEKKFQPFKIELTIETLKVLKE